MADKIPNDDLLNIPVEEKLNLIESLWESIEPDDIHLSPEQSAELDRRVAFLEKNPDCGIPWETVKEQLRSLLQK